MTHPLEMFAFIAAAIKDGARPEVKPITVNGEETFAICLHQHEEGEEMCKITPLFVAVTPGMTLVDGDGDEARLGSPDLPPPGTLLC